MKRYLLLPILFCATTGFAQPLTTSENRADDKEEMSWLNGQVKTLREYYHNHPVDESTGDCNGSRTRRYDEDGYLVSDYGKWTEKNGKKTENYERSVKISYSVTRDTVTRTEYEGENQSPTVTITSITRNGKMRWRKEAGNNGTTRYENYYYDAYGKLDRMVDSTVSGGRTTDVDVVNFKYVFNRGGNYVQYCIATAGPANGAWETRQVTRYDRDGIVKTDVVYDNTGAIIESELARQNALRYKHHICGERNTITNYGSHDMELRQRTVQFTGCCAQKSVHRWRYSRYDRYGNYTVKQRHRHGDITGTVEREITYYSVLP